MILSFWSKAMHPKPYQDAREQDVEEEKPIDYSVQTPRTLARAKAMAWVEKEVAAEQIARAERHKQEDKLTLCKLVERQGLPRIQRWLSNWTEIHRAHTDERPTPDGC